MHVSYLCLVGGILSEPFGWSLSEALGPFACVRHETWHWAVKVRWLVTGCSCIAGGGQLRVRGRGRFAVCVDLCALKGGGKSSM